MLGSSLTELDANGAKKSTKIFAGGALIAKQKRYFENNQNYDSIDWTTADPVTGTTAKFGYITQAGVGYKEETEPLGQKIQLQDPAAPPEPTYDNSIGNADYPEWQCEAGTQFWGGFEGLPFHCQKKLLADLRNPKMAFLR